MTKLRASKLSISKVEVKKEKEFLIENHYQGYVASSKCFGLFDDKNELLALMSFGKPR